MNVRLELFGRTSSKFSLNLNLGDFYNRSKLSNFWVLYLQFVMVGCLVNIVTSHVENASTMDNVIISTAAVFMDAILVTMECPVQKVLIFYYRKCLFLVLLRHSTDNPHLTPHPP